MVFRLWRNLANRRGSVPVGRGRAYYPRLEWLEQRCLLSINEFATPTPNSFLEVITAGPDGNVWFTEHSANKIGQITPGGSITEFPILPVTSNAGPTGITTGPDGNLWFTESNTSKVGRIMPDGTHVTEFTIPTSNSYPTQITNGPDGNLWFIEDSTRKMGQIIPAGNVKEFSIPTMNIAPSSITAGPTFHI